nr:hypothetical protein GCM10020092_085640 [Actinoplanes digitatis]
MHVAVVGDRHRRHAEAFGLGEQILQPGGAVEHRILGVHVEMHERVRHPGPLFPAGESGLREPSPTRAGWHRGHPLYSANGSIIAAAARIQAWRVSGCNTLYSIDDPTSSAGS